MGESGKVSELQLDGTHLGQVGLCEDGRLLAGDDLVAGELCSTFEAWLECLTKHLLWW